MTDEKERDTNDQQNVKGESRQVGRRAETSGDPAIEQEGGAGVVSMADQQEGNMNNGECGGKLRGEEQGGNSF